MSTSPSAAGLASGEAASASVGPELVVGGLTSLSTVDWPGELAAVVFCQGCAWSCPYCHNAALRPFGPNGGDSGPPYAGRPWPDVLHWLETRRGLLDAVVFSGGEPLLQPGLPGAMATVRGLGFKTGLHTSGMNPAALARALPLCDWVGLDIKAPRAAYDRITGRPGSAKAAWQSLELLRKSGAAFELRTTWHPALLSEAELLALAAELSGVAGVEWRLQAFQPDGCEDLSLAAAGRVHAPQTLATALRRALGAGGSLTVRD
ncbi:MAG: anaerobic ribonucleoside-triphosphate reductase activating protein [Desulfovibrionaceae bacterium CG1_02_65_16]|nr:MAG: anaerobic ribonucleoside-triphosphate reductase activating protein [Desulfovibrionaceae bacterium CG1_02_65_16]